MFVVILRNANAFASQDIAGYLGDFGGDRGFGCKQSLGDAFLFESRADAVAQLRRLSDEFYDRYDADIVLATAIGDDD